MCFDLDLDSIFSSHTSTSDCQIQPCGSGHLLPDNHQFLNGVVCVSDVVFLARLDSHASVFEVDSPETKVV